MCPREAVSHAVFHIWVITPCANHHNSGGTINSFFALRWYTSKLNTNHTACMHPYLNTFRSISPLFTLKTTIERDCEFLDLSVNIMASDIIATVKFDIDSTRTKHFRSRDCSRIAPASASNLDTEYYIILDARIFLFRKGHMITSLN